MDPDEFEAERISDENRTFEEFEVDYGYTERDGTIDGVEEVDTDPDDHLLNRLRTSGLLTSRPTIRDFVNKIQPDWIAIASAVPSLKQIEWTLHENSNEEIGKVAWEVVRTGGIMGEVVRLREEDADEDLEVAKCMCDYRCDEGEIEEMLRKIPPLFEQEANFRPKFRLDGFVSCGK